MSSIIVTGAGSGIGYHTVTSLLKDPINRVLAVGRTMPNLIKLQEAAVDLSGRLEILQLDVTDYQYPGLEARLDEMGMNSVDVLINNAAKLINKPFLEHDEDDYRSLMEVNFIAPAMMIRYLMPRLRASSAAHVVNVSSVGGIQGSSKYPGVTGYASSKGALISLTECLAQEFIEEDIRVNCVAFGSVQTKMLEDNFPGFKGAVTASEAGEYLAGFALEGWRMYNGKTMAASIATPY